MGSTVVEIAMNLEKLFVESVKQSLEYEFKNKAKVISSNTIEDTLEIVTLKVVSGAETLLCYKIIFEENDKIRGILLTGTRMMEYYNRFLSQKRFYGARLKNLDLTKSYGSKSPDGVSIKLDSSFINMMLINLDNTKKVNLNSII